jgi:hypothetical protein
MFTIIIIIKRLIIRKIKKEQCICLAELANYLFIYLFIRVLETLKRIGLMVYDLWEKARGDQNQTPSDKYSFGFELDTIREIHLNLNLI